MFFVKFFTACSSISSHPFYKASLLLLFVLQSIQLVNNNETKWITFYCSQGFIGKFNVNISRIVRNSKGGMTWMNDSTLPFWIQNLTSWFLVRNSRKIKSQMSSHYPKSMTWQQNPYHRLASHLIALIIWKLIPRHMITTMMMCACILVN